MSILLLITILFVFVNLVLGFFVLLNEYKNATNVVFFLMVVAFCALSIINYLVLTTPEESISLFWVRVEMVIAATHTFLFPILAKTFPSKKLIYDKSILLFTFIFTFVCIISFSPLIFENLEIVNERRITTPGKLIPFYGAYIVLLIGWAISTLIVKYKKSKDILKHQLRSLLIGSSFTYSLLIIFNFIIVNAFKNSDFTQLTPFFSLPFIFFTAYAILKYQLFDIKIALIKILIALIWIGSFVRLFFMTNLRNGLTDLGIFVFTIILGLILLKNINKEVEQKELLAKLDKDLEEKNKKLEELNAFKSQFLSFASHQIKTPVAVIKGFSGLIYDGSYGQVSDKVKEVVGRIKEVSDQMVVLLNNFLDLRRIDEGRMEYAFAKNNLVTLAKEIVADLQIMANNKKLQLTGEYESEEINANIDQDKFRQVIQNLAENAIKYTEIGSIKLTIKKENNFALVCVADTGRGMNKEILPKLFEQFNRDPKAAKEIAGTGLGLYIAKQITLAHKGEIWAESDGERKGSRFCVKIPLEK